MTQHTPIKELERRSNDALFELAQREENGAFNGETFSPQIEAYISALENSWGSDAKWGSKKIEELIKTRDALVEALKISQELLISLHVYEINDAHRRAIGNVIVNNAEAIKLAGES